MALSFVGYESINIAQAPLLASQRGGDIDGSSIMFSAINTFAKPLNLNARLIAAVIFHETGALTSTRYKQWRNPGGIAISSGTSVEVWRPNVPPPEAVGAMMVAAIGQKVLRRQFRSEIPIAYAVPGMATWLARSFAFTQMATFPKDTTLTTQFVLPFKDDTGDLQYVWAEDQNWWKGVEAYYALIQTGKDRDTVATPPKPTIYDLSRDFARFGLSKGEADILLSKRIPNRLGYKPQGIVFHIQDGQTRGSLSYWVGVQASSNVMIQKDGSILLIIPNEHGPWTNGDVANPSAHGRTLISQGGGDPNRVTISAEVEGGPWDTQPEAQKQACIWWALDVMRQFPNIGIEDIYRHADINSVTRPNCPGNYYDGVIAGIKAAKTTPEPAPKPTIDWVRGEAGIESFNGTPVLKLVVPVIVKADTTSRWAASSKAKAYKSLKKGATGVAVGTYDSGWAVVDLGDGAFARVATMRLAPTLPKPKDMKEG